MPEFSTDDLWAALTEAAKTTDDGGYTAAELSDKLGLRRAAIMMRLGKLNRQGLLVAGRRSIIAIDGTLRHVPCYRIKKG